MTLQLDRLDHLGASAFEGFVVRKDLVRRYARSYPVPAYVVEFLLGRYCASTEEAEIKEGLEIVEKQLKDRCVRTGQEEVFKNEAYRKGSVRIIDTVRARLDAKNACYIAELPSLALRDVRISDSIVEENERILIDLRAERSSRQQTTGSTSCFAQLGLNPPSLVSGPNGLRSYAWFLSSSAITTWSSLVLAGRARAIYSSRSRLTPT